MADVSSLANKAYEAYSKGITGFSVEPVRQAAKEKRDYEREEIKSIYDITADLDAQAYGTVSDFVDQMFAGIESKEYYYDSPEMVQKLSALRGKAKAIKETDAILKAATDQFTKNPDGFVYNRKDANGNIVAGGYEDFVKDLEARRSETFETPEQYTQSITGMLQNVGSRIDEKQIVPKIQKSISDLAEEYHKTIEAAKVSGEPVKIGRSLYRVDQNTDISDFENEITDAIIAGYADDLGQLAALERGRGRESVDDITFAKKFVKDNLPLTRVAMSTIKDTAPPRTTKDDSKSTRIYRSGSGWRNDNAIFQKIGENEVKVNSTGSSDPTKAWAGEGMFGEGDKGAKSTATSVFRDEDGRLFIKLVGEGGTPLTVRSVPFDKNSDLFFEVYGMTADDFDTIIRDEEVKDTNAPPAAATSEPEVKFN